MTEKRNIHALIEKEAPSLNNLLMRMSVLQDMKYPTKAAKYWQCVREQNVFLENLMSLSFDCRRNEAKIKWLEKKIEKETDEYKLEKYKIDLDEARYGLANMQLVARDRMREIKLWSTLKKEFNDGSFDTKDVNTHQLESYHHIMKNKAETLTSGSSQPEVFNVLGQLKTIERVKKSGEMIYNKKEQLAHDLGAKEK